MHVNNKKISFDIFIVRNLLNIFMEHDLNILMIFGFYFFFYNFDTHNVFLAVNTNIACAAYDCVCAPGSHIW